MQTPGRTQAAIELLTELAETQRPADRLIAYYFKNRRYIGSKDKKAIAEIVYGVLRQRGLILWALEGVGAPQNIRMQVALWWLYFCGEKDLRPIFSGEEHAPQKLWRSEKPVLEAPAFIAEHKENMPLEARFNCPQWLVAPLEEAFGPHLPAAMEALNTQAPTDVRINTLKTTIAAATEAFKKEGYTPKKVPYAPCGLRFEDAKNIFSLPFFLSGWFEVQDAGSQLLALLAGAKPGQKVVDFCAGAGGKSLALAAQMTNKGTLTLGDVTPHKLLELRKRLRRAGVDNAKAVNWLEEGKTWLKRHQGTQDVVLLDVPCTGSGVWRRNPDAKWRLTPTHLAELQAMQHDILAQGQKLVRVGGRLIYGTCSVLPAENAQQITQFLKQNPNFTLTPVAEVWADLCAQGVCTGLCPPTEEGMLTLAPHRSGTDGFFAAVLERKG